MVGKVLGIGNFQLPALSAPSFSDAVSFKWHFHTTHTIYMHEILTRIMLMYLPLWISWQYSGSYPQQSLVLIQFALVLPCLWIYHARFHVAYVISPKFYKMACDWFSNRCGMGIWPISIDVTNPFAEEISNKMAAHFRLDTSKLSWFRHGVAPFGVFIVIGWVMHRFYDDAQRGQRAGSNEKLRIWEKFSFEKNKKVN